MISAVGWACAVVAAVLIVCACCDIPARLRRRPPAPSTEARPDDFPTEPLPVIPAAPDLETWMPRTEELLWSKGAEDCEGRITLGLLPEPAGQLGVLMDVGGEGAGVRLDRHEVQGLRDALTCHLVGTAKPVRS